MRMAPQETRTYFCTFSTAGRRRLFQVVRNAQLLVEVLDHYRTAQKFELHAYVVMPDHVHVLVTPAPDVSMEKVIQFIKGGFSVRLKSSFDVWERGHFDKRVSDREAYEKCVVYIHQNLVKEMLCTTAEAFVFSSAHERAQVDPMPQWMGAEAKAS